MFQHVRPVIAPYPRRPAVCHDYDPRAGQVARQIATLICEHLPQLVVEHVGSTSVSGCAGRGIVDLMIPISEQQAEPVQALLEQLGFQHQQHPDPFPEERPMRVGAWEYEGTLFRLHVHVIPKSSPEVDDMRFFRTCLQSDPELLKLYVARKRAIVEAGTTDPVAYGQAKSEFIKESFG